MADKTEKPDKSTSTDEPVKLEKRAKKLSKLILISGTAVVLILIIVGGVLIARHNSNNKKAAAKAAYEKSHPASPLPTGPGVGVVQIAYNNYLSAVNIEYAKNALSAAQATTTKPTAKPTTPAPVQGVSPTGLAQIKDQLTPAFYGQVMLASGTADPIGCNHTLVQKYTVKPVSSDKKTAKVNVFIDKNTKPSMVVSVNLASNLITDVSCQK